MFIPTNYMVNAQFPDGIWRLEPWEVIRGALMNVISTLLRESPQDSLTPRCEVSKKTLPMTRHGFSSLQNCDKLIVCHLSQPSL